MRKRDVFAVGLHFVEHYRRRLAEVGIEQVARQMRKQGVPPDIAALILAPQTCRHPQGTQPMSITLAASNAQRSSGASVAGNVKIGVPAGTVSPPIPVSSTAVVVALPGSGGTMLVEATWSIQPDVDAGLATWFPWDAGTVSANSNQSLSQATAVRFTATGANGVGEVAR